MLLISYGTRPEYLKIEPLLSELDKLHIKYITLFTRQHSNIINCKANISIDIPVNDNRLNSICCGVLANSNIFDDITYVLVQGDTTSAFAVALSAFHNNIPIIHLEAGLRTYDMQNPYPEEFNRQCISKIAQIHLCPTETSLINLNLEHVDGKKFVVGNTSIDRIKNIIPESGNDILITLHRRENQNIMVDWFREINFLARIDKSHNFKIIKHPSIDNDLYKKLDSCIILESMSHKYCIDILKSCSLVITDSGGIQEESTFLQKKCIVCRKKTERTESIGLNFVLCKKPDDLYKIYSFLQNNNCGYKHNRYTYGDGTASIKIAKILKECVI